MSEQPNSPALAAIHWLGHDSFRIADPASGKQIYVDPYQLKRHEPKADVILITHDHFDHLSADDIARLRKPDTIFVAPPAAADQIQGDVIRVNPGDRVTAAGIPIEAVPAYNTTKFRAPGQPFHPKEAGYVGSGITVAGERVYHLGDTDLIPELGQEQGVDVALSPVSGTYVMTADEAGQAAKVIRPKVAVPMHYAAIVGSEADAQHFADLCRAEGIAVQVLQPSQ